MRYLMEGREDDDRETQMERRTAARVLRDNAKSMVSEKAKRKKSIRPYHTFLACLLAAATAWALRFGPAGNSCS